MLAHGDCESDGEVLPVADTSLHYGVYGPTTFNSPAAARERLLGGQVAQLATFHLLVAEAQHGEARRRHLLHVVRPLRRLAAGGDGGLVLVDARLERARGVVRLGGARREGDGRRDERAERGEELGRGEGARLGCVGVGERIREAPG